MFVCLFSYHAHAVQASWVGFIFYLGTFYLQSQCPSDYKYILLKWEVYVWWGGRGGSEWLVHLNFWGGSY